MVHSNKRAALQELAAMASVAIDREVPCVYRFVAKRHRLIKNNFFLIIICPTK